MKKTFFLGIGVLLVGLVVYATSTVDVNSIPNKTSSDSVTELEFNKIIGVLKGIFNIRISDTEYHIGLNGVPSDGVDLTVHGVMRTEPRNSNITCNSAAAGTMFFNSTNNHLWGCNGTDIVKLDGVTEYNEFTCTAGSWSQGGTCLVVNYNSGNSYNPSDTVCASVIPNNDTCNVVACGEITDVNLQAAIVEALPARDNWADVTTDDLEGMAYLDASSRGIASMSGICKLSSIQTLKLNSNNIISFSEGLWGLTNLTNLTLAFNDIAGSIPAEIGNLTNLTSLGLAYNDLTGEIPAEIGNLTALTDLQIHINNLTGEIPAEIGNLNNLEIFSLSSNQLTGEIPAEIGNLSSLKSLSLADNQLTGAIPAEIGNLTNELYYLNLSNNQLTSVPTEINNLTGLESLYIQDNPAISSFPDGVYASNALNVANTGLCCANIDQTNIASCLDGGAVCAGVCSEEITDVNLQNAIVAEVGAASWAAVTTADLEGITSLHYNGDSQPKIVNIDGICKLSNLIQLFLYNNNITSIPSSIGSLTELRSLRLDLNQITGTIPSSIGNLVNLTYLDLYSNQITGIIPTEIGNLTSLIRLRMDYNQLSGEIPSEIWGLTSLTYLNLYSNQLSGSIPSEIGNLINLTSLLLGRNQLTGTIPSEIGNLINITSGVLLDNNQLTGVIPNSIGNLINMGSYLYLNNNQLTGSIPSEIGNLTNITRLYLNDNQLTGEIPATIGNLTNLTEFRLSGNQLGGSIPTEIGNLTNLTALSLQENLFTSLPSTISNLVDLMNFYINDNSSIATFPSGVTTTNLNISNIPGLTCAGIDTSNIGTCTD